MSFVAGAPGITFSSPATTKRRQKISELISQSCSTMILTCSYSEKIMNKVLAYLPRTKHSSPSAWRTRWMCPYYAWPGFYQFFNGKTDKVFTIKRSYSSIRQKSDHLRVNFRSSPVRKIPNFLPRNVCQVATIFLLSLMCYSVIWIYDVPVMLTQCSDEESHLTILMWKALRYVYATGLARSPSPSSKASIISFTNDTAKTWCRTPVPVQSPVPTL
jgi:hypothetical protein